MLFVNSSIPIARSLSQPVPLCQALSPVGTAGWKLPSFYGWRDESLKVSGANQGILPW